MEMHLTRPPRLEGVVKEAMMQPKRKPKARKPVRRETRKPQSMSVRQRRQYHLKSAHH